MSGSAAQPRSRGLRRAAQQANHGETQAAQWLQQGLAVAGLSAAELPRLKGTDPRKLALAWLLWKRTTVSQQWLAERLHMRSAANVSQQLRRTDEQALLKHLPKALRQFLKAAPEAGDS